MRQDDIEKYQLSVWPILSYGWMIANLVHVFAIPTWSKQSFPGYIVDVRV
jgi:hypothetical protein